MIAITTSSSIRVKPVTSGEWRITLGDWRLALGYRLLANDRWRWTLGDWRLAISYSHHPRLGHGDSAREP
jgi:hypothetical protein